MLARSPETSSSRRGTRIVVTIAAAAVIVATVSLGNWQLRRAEQREAAFATATVASETAPIDLADAGNEMIIGRRVTATGELVGAATIYLDNKQRDGLTGFEVLTPLKLANGTVLMINRGFMPVRPEGRESIVAPTMRPGPVTVEGTAIDHVGRALELGHVEHRLGGIWTNYSLEEYQRISGLAVQPGVVEQTSDTGDGLIRRWPAPGAGSQQNRSYALQWYSMATLAIAGWLWFTLAPLLRRSRKQAS